MITVEDAHQSGKLIDQDTKIWLVRGGKAVVIGPGQSERGIG